MRMEGVSVRRAWRLAWHIGGSRHKLAIVNYVRLNHMKFPLFMGKNDPVLATSFGSA